MLIDKLASYDSNATITGGTTTASVDYMKHTPQSGNRNLGTGKQLYLVVAIKNNTGGDGADTFQVNLVTDTNSNFATAKAVVAASPTITGVANFPAGSRIVIPVPPGVAFKTYSRAEYALTASAVVTADVFLTDQVPPDTTTYNDAI